MRIRRLLPTVAVMAIAALVAGGCSSAADDGGGDGGDASQSGTSASSGSDDATGSDTETSQSQEPADDVSLWIQNGATSQAIQDYLADWGPKHNINVKVTVQASDQYTQAITLALKTGKAPDIFLAQKTDQLVDAGYLLPLNDAVSDDVQAQYSGALKSPSSFIYDGKIYAIPTTTNTKRLAYNKDIFKKAGLDPSQPPSTFGEIEADCQAIAKVDGVYCFGLPLNWAGYVSWMLEPMAVAGTDFNNTQFYRSAEGKYDYSLAKPAVKLFRDMVAKKWAYPGASSLDNDAMRSAFAEGKIGMFVSASWDIGLINDKFNTKADWAAGPLPVPDGQQLEQSLMNVGTAYSINAKAKNPEAAAQVVDALVGSDLSGKLANAGLIISANQDVKVAADSLAPQFADYALSDADVMQIPGPAGQLKLTGDTVADVITKLVLGSDDIDSALADSETKYNNALESAVDAGELSLDDYR